MTHEEAKQFIADNEWVFAKTYASTFPHEYTTRDRVKDDKKFNDFIQYIRDNAKLKPFFKFVYLYCEIGDMEYWEMGRPIKTAVVINRAKINDDADYRKKITVGDKELKTMQKLLQDREDRYKELESKELLTQEEADELAGYKKYKGTVLDELPKINSKDNG